MAKSILVLGAAKSGTTALFYAVRNALRAEGLAVTGLLEPHEPADLMRHLSETTDDIILVKALLSRTAGWIFGFAETFERIVLIVRDPRDNVVSHTVFKPKDLVSPQYPSRREQLVRLFEQKERDPESISVVGLIQRMGEIAGRSKLLNTTRNNSLMSAAIKREHSGRCFVLAYDDFIAGRTEPLSNYLGLTVTGGVEVDDRHAFVARSKRSGDWRDWFLQEDVEFFVTPAGSDFRFLGFDPDEAPNALKVIEPDHCSGYVRRQFARLDQLRRERKDAIRNNS